MTEKANMTRRSLLMGGVAALTVIGISHFVSMPRRSGSSLYQTVFETPVQADTIMADWGFEPPYGVLIRNDTLETAQNIWVQANYSDDVFKGDRLVSPVFSLPVLKGLSELTVQKRKAAFLMMLMPHVVLANHIILLQRERLEAIYERGRNMTLDDRAFVAALATRMRLESLGYSIIPTLLDHVDVIPVSLALAQGAAESGWGTSRFAREGNALFGVWTWEQGSGLIPEDRTAGKTHTVKAYANIYQTVTDYIDNLNRHRAYKDLRAIRKQARVEGFLPKGYDMAAGLLSYSERRQVYVDELRAIMRVNRLAALDNVKIDLIIPQIQKVQTS